MSYLCTNNQEFFCLSSRFFKFKFLSVISVAVEHVPATNQLVESISAKYMHTSYFSLTKTPITFKKEDEIRLNEYFGFQD